MKKSYKEDTFFGRRHLASIIRDLSIGKIKWTDPSLFSAYSLLDKKEIKELESIVDSFSIDLDFIKSKQDRELLIFSLKQWSDIYELSIKVLSNPIDDGYVDRIELKIDKILVIIKEAYIYCFLENKTEKEVNNDDEFGGFLIVCEELDKTLIRKKFVSLFILGDFSFNEDEALILKIIIYSFKNYIFMGSSLVGYKNRDSDLKKDLPILINTYERFFSDENLNKVGVWAEIFTTGKSKEMLSNFYTELLSLRERM